MTELTIWAIDDACLVERFAVAMAERLRWNAKYRNKSGWQDMTPKQLLRRAEWLRLYRAFCKAFHVNPETFEQYEARLSEDRIANGEIVS